MKKRFPKLYCTCGHLDTAHAVKIYVKRFCGDCNCVDFRLDALLYLEELDRTYYGR